MKNLISKTKNFVERHKKGLAVAVPLTIATISGTYGGIEGGLPPLYNNKVGTSYGINIGAYTKFNPGSKFYGLSLSLWNNNAGEINGLEVGLANIGLDTLNLGEVNGAQISLAGNYGYLNTFPKVNGLQISCVNKTEGNTLQIGLFNMGTRQSNVVQLGVYNTAKIDSLRTKRGIGVNYKFNRGKGHRN